ncbi:hypothetical protein Deia_00243 [Candidatus Deianiraea vastatrix]|uniref:Uncharacterized protein n=1 Tax=Candidatus Deianiraea vastatrix TaxID=2163644 RepID=A0A5B8XFH0_9RICK|nr:hypothetical protein Deia_00243 [Candidatus Deianiraea vastatrix]
MLLIICCSCTDIFFGVMGSALSDKAANQKNVCFGYFKHPKPTQRKENWDLVCNKYKKDYENSIYSKI